MPTFIANHTTRAYLLLTVSALLWGGNMVAARLAVGHVSPMALTFLRWVVCFGALSIIARRDLSEHWRALLPHWKFVLPMGAVGLTVYAGLLYLAAGFTSGVNLSIIQGSIPVFVLIGAFLFQRSRISRPMLGGVVLTLIGILFVATRGHLETLSSLSFNIGDIFVLVACICYAGYALGLPHRPPVPGIVFFASLALVGALTALPMFLIEWGMGQSLMPDVQGLAILAFIGLGPSFLAQLTFMQGVTLIGPSRAGLFVNLVPIFGALMSVAILGEPFEGFHAVALGCVLGGIFVAEKWRV